MGDERVCIVLECRFYSVGLVVIHHDHCQVMLLVVTITLCCASSAALEIMRRST